MNEIDPIDTKVVTCFYCSCKAEYFCDRIVTEYEESQPPLEMWKACDRPLCEHHKKTVMEAGEMIGMITTEDGARKVEMDSSELCLEHANDEFWFYPIKKSNE